MLRTTKKEAIFYTEFLEVITLTHEAALHLDDLVNNYTDIESKIEKLSEYEHTCDAKIHKIFERVNAAFITPIDREDICLLSKSMDDIMDHIEEAGCLFLVYNTKEILPAAKEISKLIVEACLHLMKVVKYMSNMKSLDKLREGIIEVNRVENQGDTIYRQELSKLFREETDPIQVIRWNGIFDRLEKALDACEIVANLVEGVVMKHA
ncbi:MAG: DUF47 family protein [Bacillota bacterium]|nr:DUF47 family protein [Bacillota bacterium]